ncbi:MAG: hypothetical protein KI789_05885 [Hoeflea sp.]|nr:hypothetical protein [Hoeflea sp.]
MKNSILFSFFTGLEPLHLFENRFRHLLCGSDRHHKPANRNPIKVCRIGRVVRANGFKGNTHAAIKCKKPVAASANTSGKCGLLMNLGPLLIATASQKPARKFYMRSIGEPFNLLESFSSSKEKDALFA